MEHGLQLCIRERGRQLESAKLGLFLSFLLSVLLYVITDQHGVPSVLVGISSRDSPLTRECSMWSSRLEF